MSSAWPMLFAPSVWLIIRYGVIGHEEAHLESCFGDEYRVYRAKVRRWL
jgi:protein-S-isoprenylcysteine O-methyltransferase Ste14